MPDHPPVQASPPTSHQTIEPAELHRRFVEYRRTGDVRIRNRIVEAHLHLADYWSRRYGQHELRDDLRQVARMAIVHAAERFDPDLGVSFRTFAARTIEGDCKRFLRDRSWDVRPPRAVLELALVVRRQHEELSHVLGRAPTVAEVAERIDEPIDAVLEAMEAYGSRDAVSTDERGAEGAQNVAVARACRSHEHGFGSVDDRVTVAPAVARLGGRERELLRLRFVERRSQSELAAHFGLSQSYVSRFLNSVLVQLRREIGSC